MLLAPVTVANAQSVQKHIYAYKGGKVVYRGLASDVDSIALEQNKSVVGLYHHGDSGAQYSALYSDIDSISFSAPVPKADLLDVVFNSDSTATDVSPMKNSIVAIPSSGKAEVDYNNLYDLWESHFYGQSWAGAPASTVFKVNYNYNTKFKNGLAAGTSWETLFRVDYDGTIPNAEAKFFSTHQAGGVGFLICTKANGLKGGNEITFLVYTTGPTRGWKFCPSGIVPQPGKYYHVVGVWDKDAGKASIYVDGELKNTVDASGTYVVASSGSRWVGIGCDANNGNGQQTADSHVAIARIYSEPLTQSDVDGLWEEVADKAQAPEADLLDVQFNADGSATDISPMKNTVQTVGAPETYYSEPYGKYVARTVNNWSSTAGSAKNYYKVDFENNQAFRDSLADGHSIETVYKTKYTTLPDHEIKWFAAHQAGGTGFLICTKNRGKDGGNEITFLPNVSTTSSSNWRFCPSGVVPQSDVYYDVVGVYNKQEEKAYVYVNGELKNTVDAKGNFRFASKGSNWWGIGCDAAPAGGQNGGDFEIVNARVFSSPLSQHDVAALWNNVAAETKAATDSVAKGTINPEDTVTVNAPKADLMDIEFGAAGAVADEAVASHNPTWMIGDKAWTKGSANAPTTYYNTTYGRYVAHFDNEYGTVPQQYVLAYDYSSDQSFKDSIADGHTLEVLAMENFGDQASGKEVKPFSSHEAGGTGLMLEQEGDWTFLPNVGGSYTWTTSGVQPKQQRFYHIVGVYNKAKGTASIYVDGELKNTVPATGDFKFASTGSQRFIVGGDPTTGSSLAQAAWSGDIVYARAYSAPLTAAQVRALYKANVTDSVAKATSLVSDVSYYESIPVKVGGTLSVSGKGFKAGDKIAVVAPGYDLNAKIELPITVTSTGADITVPQGIEANTCYAVYVERGSQIQSLGVFKFNVVDSVPAGSRVIAHRGYWNTTGSAQNSRSSLRNAIAQHCYGSETDVWLTTDGKLMVNHDASFNGVTIASSTSARCKTLKLANGETMPELSDFLDIIKAENWTTDTTKLIIEIKSHSTTALSRAAADSAVALVKSYGLQNRVEYISFSLDACREIAQADPTAKVAYLNGNYSPASLHNYGITGLDYTLSVFKNHPSYISDAKKLGMTTNVWTIDSADEIAESTNLGIDFITTNNPVEALRIQKIYDSAQ